MPNLYCPVCGKHAEADGTSYDYFWPNQIAFIKHLRQELGLGLHAAKQFADACRDAVKLRQFKPPVLSIQECETLLDVLRHLAVQYLAPDHRPIFEGVVAKLGAALGQ